MEQKYRRLGGAGIQAEDGMSDPCVRNGSLKTLGPCPDRTTFFSRVRRTHSELGGATADLQEEQDGRKRLKEGAVQSCHKSLWPHG